jgi:hypothetical protein
VMATDVTLRHMRKTQTIFSNFLEPKNFQLSMYAPLQKKYPIVTAIYMGESDTYSEEEHTIYSLSFNGKQFLLFVERGKILRNKLVFLWKIMEKSPLILFLGFCAVQQKIKSVFH